MKGIRFIIVMIIVVVTIWIGFGIFLDSSSIEVNPNASSYTKPLNKAFNLEGFDNLVVRIEENLPVSPDAFRDLVQVEEN